MRIHPTRELQGLVGSGRFSFVPRMWPVRKVRRENSDWRSRSSPSFDLRADCLGLALSAVECLHFPQTSPSPTT